MAEIITHNNETCSITHLLSSSNFLRGAGLIAELITSCRIGTSQCILKMMVATVFLLQIFNKMSIGGKSGHTKCY